MDAISDIQPVLTGDRLATGARVRRNRYSQRIVCHLLALLEAVLIGGTAFLLVHGAPQGRTDWIFAAQAGIAMAAITAFFAFLSGAASFERFSSRLSLLPGAVAGSFYIALTEAMTGVGLGYAVFSVAAIFAFIYSIKFVTANIKTWLTDRGFLVRLVAIATDNPTQQTSLSKLLRRRDDIEVVFVGSPSALDVFSHLTQDHCLDEIILAGHEANEENIAALAGLAVTLVRVTPQDRLEHRPFSPHWGKKRTFSAWGAPAAIIAQPPLAGWSGILKRGIDIVGATTAILLFSPILLICAIMVKLDSPGPVFFVQERAGYRNKSFRMLKFRSMRTDRADVMGSQLTLRQDPRVTRIGSFLRRSSADELPQLFNVLVGDMSLVGPRPHPKGAKAGTTLYDELIPNFYSRYRMKPGITGLAQISGLRGNTETEQHLIDRFGTDLQYAAEWTPFLDIAIILRTISHLAKGTNAY